MNSIAGVHMDLHLNASGLPRPRRRCYLRRMSLLEFRRVAFFLFACGSEAALDTECTKERYARLWQLVYLPTSLNQLNVSAFVKMLYGPIG